MLEWSASVTWRNRFLLRNSCERCHLVAHEWLLTMTIPIITYSLHCSPVSSCAAGSPHNSCHTTPPKIIWHAVCIHSVPLTVLYTRPLDRLCIQPLIYLWFIYAPAWKVLILSQSPQMHIGLRRVWLRHHSGLNVDKATFWFAVLCLSESSWH